MYKYNVHIELKALYKVLPQDYKIFGPFLISAK